MKRFLRSALGIVLPLTFACILAWGISQRGSLKQPAGQIAAQATSATPTPSTPTSVPSVILVATESGQTAYELLRAQHQVDAQEYDFGVFITSIDGIAGDQQNFWALYHNGEKATVGADQLELVASDEVSFVYEAIAWE